MKRWLPALMSVVVLSVFLVSGASAKVVYVDGDAPGPVHDGATWATAFLAVQNGMSASANGDELWVAEGTYTELVSLPKHLALYGGFDGTETERDQRNWTIHRTILDGGGSGRVVRCSNVSFVLDGFTIRNSSFWGSGIDAKFCNSVTLSNNTVTGAGDAGVTIHNCDDVALSRNTISDNRIGVLVSSSAVTLTSNTISGSGLTGVHVSSGTVALVNNTISGNGANGLSLYGSGSASVNNNIVAHNESHGILKDADFGSLNLSHNDVYGNESGNYSGVSDPTGTNGNISDDPRLAHRFHDLHIQPDSLCVDAGDDTEDIGPTDMDGQPRIQGSRVDIGADESDGTEWSLASRTWHVSPSGDDASDGLSWETAKRTVNGAISAARGFDELWVASGTYAERITSPAAVALYGGFSGTETTRGQRDWKAHPTILEGDGSGAVVTCHAIRFVMDGFTIRNARYGTAPGVRIIGTATLSNNSISACGYGVSGEACSVALIDNTIHDNLYSGVSVYEGTATLTGNTIFGNRSGVGVTGTATLVKNTIYGNRWGFSLNGNASLVNNTISANGHGGVSIFGTAATLTGNTISRNGAYGVQCHGASIALTNNIVAFNVRQGVVIEQGGSASSFSHNDVYGNELGNYSGMEDPTGTNGNISVDPMLSNVYHDIHIQPESPCRDAGDDSVAMTDTDRDGQPRIQGAHVDIGSDESDGTVWVVPPIVWHVSPSGDDSADGRTWVTAKRTVKAALAESKGTDEVWVAQGIYTERPGVPAGVALYGGFAGTETERDQRNPALNNSVLDGGGISTTVSCRSVGVVLDGFTIQNSAPEFGASGMAVSGTAVLRNNTFRDNASGVLVSEDGMVVLVNNTISSGRDFGVFIDDGTATLVNNTISGQGDDGVYLETGTITLTNNTITYNDGNGVEITRFGSATLTNNAIVFNRRFGISRAGDRELLLSHNDVFGNASGNYVGLPDPTGADGNLSADPLFINAAMGDFRLSTGSPCIDAGLDSAVPPGSTDLEGKPRILGQHVDIGAYEYEAATAPYTLADAALCLRVAGGLIACPPGIEPRINVGMAGPALDLQDAARLARIAVGLESYP